MKKLMSLMLGLAFIGSMTVVLADDAATTKTVVKETAKTKSKRNKTKEKKTIEKMTSETTKTT